MTKWLDAQAEFETFFPGKDSFVYQFEDTREAMGIAQSRRVFTKGRPSDYLITHLGVTFFAEVKSTQDATSFQLTRIQRAQWNCCRQVITANGIYLFFIRRESDQQWFRIPGAFFCALQDSQVKSFRFDKVEVYQWNKSLPIV